MESKSFLQIFITITMFIVYNNVYSQGIISTGVGVGIGTDTPRQKLDVNGSVAFNGALMPSNNAGKFGQFLMSQGSGLPPIWVSMVDTTVLGTSMMLLRDTSPATLVPGLSCTFKIAWAQFVRISTAGGVQSSSGALGTWCAARIFVYLDGVPITPGVEQLFAQNANIGGMYTYRWSSDPINLWVGAGTHTISIYISGGYANGTNMFVSDPTTTVYNPFRQGNLTLFYITP